MEVTEIEELCKPVMDELNRLIYTIRSQETDSKDNEKTV